MKFKHRGYLFKVTRLVSNGHRISSKESGFRAHTWMGNSGQVKEIRRQTLKTHEEDKQGYKV